MKSRSRPIPVILAIVHVITWKCAIFHSKSQNVRKIVIWELYDSHKWWNVNSHSRSIHVNFDHDSRPITKCLYEMQKTYLCNILLEVVANQYLIIGNVYLRKRHRKILMHPRVSQWMFHSTTGCLKAKSPILLSYCEKIVALSNKSKICALSKLNGKLIGG